VDERDGGVRILRFGKYGTLARFDFCRGLTSFIRHANQNYDLLHVHVPNPVMCVALALARPKIPVLMTYHSDIVKQKWMRKPFSLIEDRVLESVRKIIVTSQAYRDGSPVLARYLNKTSVIPYGLDLRPFQEPTRESRAFTDQLLAKASGEPIWMCVGRMVYYKGTEYAIRALANCPGRLLMFGNGELFEANRQLARKLGVFDRIDWYPTHTDDQLRGAYRAATALFFPSVFRSEAFGLVQIEAMASGCPVINTHIPGSGVSWVSLDTVSGLTIPMNDTEALTQAARRIAYEPGLRARLVQGALARADQHFLIDEMAQRINGLYDNVLGCPSESSTSRSSDPSPFALNRQTGCPPIELSKSASKLPRIAN
jgi:rhamnosyl/mannosyltransferase